jgi:hypothetical protein
MNKRVITRRKSENMNTVPLFGKVVARFKWPLSWGDGGAVVLPGWAPALIVEVTLEAEACHV